MRMVQQALQLALQLAEAQPAEIRLRLALAIDLLDPLSSGLSRPLSLIHI